MDFKYCQDSAEFVIAGQEQAFDQTSAAAIIAAANFPKEAQGPESAPVAPKVQSRLRRNVQFKEFLARKKEQKAQKRKSAEMNPEAAAETSKPVKQSRMLQIIGDKSKSPLQKLNEIRVPYSIEVTAVPNSNLFKSVIAVGEKRFEGVASSKQDAKQKLAAEALEFLSTQTGSAVEEVKVKGEEYAGASSSKEAELEGLAKTPVQIINEIFGANGCTWVSGGEQTMIGGPFSAALNLGTYGEFNGTGRTKKDARHAAALAGVLKIFNLPSLQGLSAEHIRAMIQQFRLVGSIPMNPTTSQELDPNSNSNIEVANNPDAVQMQLPKSEPVSFVVAPKPQLITHTPVAPKVVSAPVIKTHLQILNERFGSDKVCFTFVGEEGPANRKVFHVKVKVEGVQDEFVATGNSKQEAKQSVAAMVLASLSINEPALAPLPSNSAQGSSLSTSAQSNKPSHNAWSDFVSNLIQKKFQSLTEGTEWARRTVLAGVVMTVGDNYESTAQPICIATGTKCLSANKMSMTGAALLDCHAEVLCRRALCRYFYSHLLAMDDEALAGDAIFERRSEGKSGYRLKDGFRFHLYISTAPCGDSRIFCPTDDAPLMAANGDKHPNRVNRGLLRTKVESGEGTIPSVEEARQTWDGIHGGDRLVIVSCSDKILAWNQLGIQGNLLSQFIEPIYLTSIIVASTFNPDHLERALITRLPPLSLPEGTFTQHKPIILGISRSEQRIPSKPPRHSLLWTVCDRAFEVIDCASGRLLETNFPSSVSKLTLFRLFSTVESKLSKIVESSDAMSPSSTYRDVKKRNNAYASAKSGLLSSVLDNFLGYWPIKPVEIDSFVLPTQSEFNANS